MTATLQHHNLNPNQRRVLTLLYKFRYVSAPLLQTYLGLNHKSTIRRTLTTLEVRGYLEHLYDSSYKIERKPAIHYLSKKGIALLKDDERMNPRVLKAYYKNKSLSPELIQHKLDTLAVYNVLKAHYGDTFSIFTDAELVDFADFPKTKPDLFLRSKDGEREYFTTLAHDLPPYLLKKRLNEYVQHSEDEGWPATGTYPTLLFVVRSPDRARQASRYAKDLLDNTGIPESELPIAHTTITALTAAPSKANVWTYLDSPVPRAFG